MPHGINSSFVLLLFVAALDPTGVAAAGCALDSFHSRPMSFLQWQEPSLSAADVRGYRKAAEDGDAVAMFDLGSACENGSGGLVKSDASAVQWYRKSAQAGNAQGM